MLLPAALLNLTKTLIVKSHHAWNRLQRYLIKIKLQNSTLRLSECIGKFISLLPSVAAKHHPCGGVKFKIISFRRKKIRHLGGVYCLSSLLKEENYAKHTPTEIKNGCPTIKATTTILIWCCITRGIFRKAKLDNPQHTLAYVRNWRASLTPKSPC